MSITAQEVTGDHIYLHDSEKGDITVTKAEIIDYFNSSTAIDKQTDTVTWIKNRIISFVGEETISPETIFVNFDLQSKMPTDLILGSI